MGATGFGGGTTCGFGSAGGSLASWFSGAPSGFLPFSIGLVPVVTGFVSDVPGFASIESGLARRSAA